MFIMKEEETDENLTFGEFMKKAKRGELSVKEKEKLDEMGRLANEILEHQIKKEAQPFKTNALLENLIKGQPAKWISYAILIVSSVILIISIITLLK